MSKENEYRTIDGDIANIAIILLECKMACDIEMVNMGDWSIEDYDKHCEKYYEAIRYIKKKNTIYGTDPKILEEIEHTFSLFFKTFREHKV